MGGNFLVVVSDIGVYGEIVVAVFLISPCLDV